MLMIARSFWMKAVVTTVAAGAFVWLYEVRFLDSRYMLQLASDSASETGHPPPVGKRLTFSATAYCKGLQTSTGVAVQRGIAAADPTVLPLGSVLSVDANDLRYNGIYTVLDTGPQVRGRELDLYLWSCTEAVRFGRRSVKLTLLRLGWDPSATSGATPGTFSGPETRQPLPARPLPVAPTEAQK